MAARGKEQAQSSIKLPQYNSVSIFVNRGHPTKKKPLNESG